jgi:two-component sensor histidine kinase
MMDRWISALHYQARSVGSGTYIHDVNIFANAPPNISALSNELQIIANAISERDRLQQSLVREVHHRVKNSLQIVTSLLNMQAKKLNDSEAKRALGQTRARMGALALIHRLIYDQGDEAANGEIKAETLMANLCKQLRISSQEKVEVTLECEVCDFGVPLNDAVPLALLTVEAVTNAFGHGFPEHRSGKVKVDFSKKNKTRILNITDNGMGFSPAAAYTSMGRQLMDALAYQLHGDLSINSSATAGTTVSLSYLARQ